MTAGQEATTARTPDLGRRFHAAVEAVTRRLPFGLRRVVAPSFLGFALINGSTFALDLLLLTLFRSVLRWPVPVAFTVAYLIAFAVSFALNRALNFRSHAPVGPQAVLYGVAVLINYLVFVLGLGSGLAALGVQYHLSRLTAGVCEAVYTYSVMRWVVFRDAEVR
ncbi:GtrA family protein [Saccharopolyspora rhizosphaerae]|uniref:GtrA family protein n=1 Tax=Saccharopolyspora rhizosphaerae TaxID=2492662 RepID=A0A3R8Q6H3_9PSEU|nr:GtrA family protein [Saccharopolyspora rhizosphaerae]RRO14218.1 GtrA family protein [Saccharopolyspora rhizosphaerae]